MALSKRDDAERAPAAPLPHSQDRVRTAGPAAASGYRYDLGGLVGEMQADLARRLAAERSAALAAAARTERPEERVVHLLSKTGGFAALLAGYALVAWLLVR